MLTKLKMTEKYTAGTVALQVMELTHYQTQIQGRYHVRLAVMRQVLHPVDRSTRGAVRFQLSEHIRGPQ